MLYEKNGETAFTEGKTFTVGGDVFANGESYFEGLFGTVSEIRTGDDLESGNDTTDIYCIFEPPEDETLIKELEDRFSEAYHHRRTLEDIPLDFAIMGPEMLEPIPAQLPEAQGEIYSLTYYRDDDNGCTAGTLAVSHDIGVLLRRMLMDLDTYEAKVLLSHAEQTINGYRFAYEAKDTGIEGLYLGYDISTTPILPSAEVRPSSLKKPPEWEELREIECDGITQQLFDRYICSYLLYDYNVSHANRCFYNNDFKRRKRAVEKAKASPLNGRNWVAQVTWAYNTILAEDTEELIAHICGEHTARAEYEVLLAETMQDYMNLPSYGQKGE